MTTQYQTEQDTDTPLARWRFEETTGTTFADSAGSATATIVGSVTPGVLVAGPYVGAGYGADFAGGSAQLASVSAWRPQTVEVLAQFDTVPSSARPWIFGHDLTTGSNAAPLLLGWNIDGSNAGKLGVGWWTGSAYRTVHMPSALSTGALHHIVGVYDGATTLTLYVDGTSVATGTVTARGTLTTVSGTAWIGRRFDGSTVIDGRLYDLALYNSALSAARVTAHYAASQQIAGLAVSGGGGMTGWGGTPRSSGTWGPVSGGGSIRFVSSVVSVGSPSEVTFTAHPGDYAGTPSPWWIQEKLSDGTTLTTTDHSTHIYTPGGQIERVLASVITTREDSNLLALAAACHPAITTPGAAQVVPWRKVQQNIDIQAGDGAWPVGERWARNLYLAWQRINSTVTIAGDAILYIGNIVVLHLRYNYAGQPVDVAAAPALDVQGLVHDLMGRGVNELVEFDPAAVQPGTRWGTVIQQAAWWNGVSAREVLELATTNAPAMWWMVVERGPSGLPRFRVGRWDAPPRYVIPAGAGDLEMSGGANDVANRCLVRYIGSTYGNTSTVWVAAVRANLRGLAEAGVTRTMTLDLTSEGLLSTQAARLRGVSALRQAAQAKTAGRVVVRGPVLDRAWGRMVEPWELEPGCTVVVGDAPLSFGRSTSLTESVGADGVSVFRCTGVAYEVSSNTATLTLDGGSRSLLGRMRTESTRRRYDVGSPRV